MLSPITFEDLSKLLTQALASGVFSADDDSVIFYDFTRFERLMAQLERAFPSSALHAVAIKANPLMAVLREIQRFGLGVEAASLGELELARRAGFSGPKIVFDSPVKTARELTSAFQMNARLNADSLEEVQRIAALLETPRQENCGTPLNVGIRINPQTASGKTAYTVTAGKFSKFGVALDEKRGALLECFRRHLWLNTVHVHVGSQSCSIETLTAAIDKVVSFAEEINQAKPGQVTVVDIGGGLPTAYHRDQPVPSFSEYREALERQCPALFTGEFSLITEFGRHLHSSCGTVFSRVEAVKEQCGTRTAAIHVGADLLVRECYNPGDWHHDIAVFDPTGRLKTTPLEKQTIAGPLCFSGDVLAHGRLLPRIETGDFVAIADIGAYTFSMWSRYNSRQRPKIVGYREANGFSVIQEKEKLAAVVDSWS